MRLLAKLWLGAMALGTLLLPANAQDTGEWQERLVGRPLYLRGYWQESSLEFDAVGKPTKSAHPGPLTLSGIDVTSVSVRGTTMVVHGDRVALTGTANGRLERRTPESTTEILFAMVNKEFKAKEEMKLTLHADASGSFEQPVRAVFADGLKDFSQHVPVYWLCYAEGYLWRDLSDDEAEMTTRSCLKRVHMDVARTTTGAYTRAKLLDLPKPTVTRAYAELGLNEVSVTRVFVGKDGTPLTLQIVRPVGAGLDEELMQAESRGTYQPASEDGRPVPAAIDVSIHVATRP